MTFHINLKWVLTLACQGLIKTSRKDSFSVVIPGFFCSVMYLKKLHTFFLIYWKLNVYLACLRKSYIVKKHLTYSKKSYIYVCYFFRLIKIHKVRNKINNLSFICWGLMVQSQVNLLTVWASTLETPGSSLFWIQTYLGFSLTHKI